jgi:hypothetical protein
MWNKVQSVAVIFFSAVVFIELWRITTGPWYVKPHGFIDMMIAAYIVLSIVKSEGAKVFPGAIATSFSVATLFVIWVLVN